VDGEEKPGKMDSSSDTPGNEPFFFSFFFLWKLRRNIYKHFKPILGDGVGFGYTS